MTLKYACLVMVLLAGHSWCFSLRQLQELSGREACLELFREEPEEGRQTNTASLLRELTEEELLEKCLDFLDKPCPPPPCPEGVTCPPPCEGDDCPPPLPPPSKRNGDATPPPCPEGQTCPPPPCEDEDCPPPPPPPCEGDDCPPPPPCDGNDCPPSPPPPCDGDDCPPPKDDKIKRKALLRVLEEIFAA